MEMEVVIPIHHNMDFDFNGGRSSPIHHLSTSSAGKGFAEFYCSAPTSPTRLSQFYREFDEFLMMSKENISEKGTYSAASVPFDWEEKPGIPKSAKAAAAKDEDDFAFNVGNDLKNASLSAEELFDGGVIKTLKAPPRLQLPAAAKISGTSSIISPAPTSPISQSKKIVMGAFSPGHKKESTPLISSPQKTNQISPGNERGRERSPAGMKSSSRRATRSLSPLRVSQYPWEQDEEQNSLQQKNRTESSIIAKMVANSAASALASFCQGYKKWRLKDFFLFRSASEGRAADKDSLRKYTAAFRRYEDVRTLSMRSIDSTSGSVSSRRRGPVSAHELHYTVNKAVSEDLKKRTFLPYKQGILGRLAFNPAVHALANGFGLSHK